MENGKTIDDSLFDPLRSFLMSYFLDPKEIRQFINVTGIQRDISHSPHMHYGFVLEAYAKLLLEKFRINTKIPLIPVLLKEMNDNKDSLVRSDNQWGNIVIRGPNDGKYVTEIDALYEFRDDNLSVPIILEVTSRGKTKETSKKLTLKRDWIGLFYPETKPYSLKFIINRYEKPTYYNLRGRGRGEGYSRSINMPFRKDLEDLAQTLC